jgi:hypothetical protein
MPVQEDASQQVAQVVCSLNPSSHQRVSNDLCNSLLGYEGAFFLLGSMMLIIFFGHWNCDGVFKERPNESKAELYYGPMNQK